MKKCPSCAEEIQDEAVKCRFCGEPIVLQKSEANYPKIKKANWSGGQIVLAILVVLIIFVASQPHDKESTLHNSSATEQKPLTFAERYPNIEAFSLDTQGFLHLVNNSTFTNDQLKRFTRFVEKSTGVAPNDPTGASKIMELMQQGQPGFGELFHEASELTGKCIVNMPQGQIDYDFCDQAESLLKENDYLGPSEKQADTTDSDNAYNELLKKEPLTAQATFGKTEKNNLANTFVVNVPNSKGGYTAITITQVRGGYIGEKDETYIDFPTIKELQRVYGLN